MSKPLQRASQAASKDKHKTLTESDPDSEDSDALAAKFEHSKRHKSLKRNGIKKRPWNCEAPEEEKNARHGLSQMENWHGLECV